MAENGLKRVTPEERAEALETVGQEEMSIEFEATGIDPDDEDHAVEAEGFDEAKDALLQDLAQPEGSEERQLAEQQLEKEGFDTASSASRQHYIDTGRYLKPGEALDEDYGNDVYPPGFDDQYDIDEEA